VTSNQWVENKEIWDMKRLMIAAAVFYVLSGFSSVVSGELLADIEGLSVGGELNLVKNRNMVGLDTARLSSEQILLTGEYPVTEAVSVLLKVGRADLEVHRAEGETHSFDKDFAYGAGINALLFEDIEYGYKIDLGLRYFTFEPGKGKTTGISDHLPYSLSHEVTIDWTEWQLFFKFSKPFDFFTLYGGPKYSDVKCDQERVWPAGNTESVTFEPEDNFGLFAGIDVEINPELSTCFEVKFFAETTFAMGVIYTF